LGNGWSHRLSLIEIILLIWQLLCYDKRYDFNFLIVNFPFICSNIPAAPAYGVYISQLIRYSRACGSYKDFPDRGLLLTRKLFTVGKVEVITSKILRSPPWLGWPLWNICVTNDHVYVPLVENTSRSFSHSRLITGFVIRLTWRVSLVEQELLTLLEHMSPPPVFSWARVTRSLLLYVCFVDRCLSFCTFYFGHCVVCSSSIYGFWLPLWHLQTLLKCIMHNVKDYRVLYNNAVRLAICEGWYFTHMRKALAWPHHITKRGSWAHKTSLTAPLLLKCLIQFGKIGIHVFIMEKYKNVSCLKNQCSDSICSPEICQQHVCLTLTFERFAIINKYSGIWHDYDCLYAMLNIIIFVLITYITS
jgi:hypothetical protein